MLTSRKIDLLKRKQSNAGGLDFLDSYRNIVTQQALGARLDRIPIACRGDPAVVAPDWSYSTLGQAADACPYMQSESAPSAARLSGTGLYVEVVADQGPRMPRINANEHEHLREHSLVLFVAFVAWLRSLYFISPR